MRDAAKYMGSKDRQPVRQATPEERAARSEVMERMMKAIGRLREVEK